MEPETKYIIAGIVLILSLGIGLSLAEAYFEAKAFNRFSEKPATILDALSAELRIEACN